MSNRAKLLVSVLFIAVIILCVGLTRFYFDVTKNTGSTNVNDSIESIVRNYGDKWVFESTNGCYGVLDEEDAVIIEPEWMEILDVTSDLVLVSSRIRDTVLIGGIDYEENVILPFVYRTMQPLGEQYYAGIVDADDSCIIYTSEYKPVFFRSYDSASYESGMLRLGIGESHFYYYVADDTPLLRKAELSCAIENVTLDWRIGNRVYLTDLHEEDLMRINACVSSYMDMLVCSDFSDLPQISAGDYLTGLTKPGSFSDMQFEQISDFSFSLQETGSDTYVFAFSIGCRMTNPETEINAMTVQVRLYFRRNTDNTMILTSAGLDYQPEESE
ncbi:MAG: hypothetical protein K2I93_06585 [Oscillospiraceae bacterium]|nr:hypothetical protein [Oscillospiraceae bacterium]